MTALGASHLTTACFVSKHYSPRCVTPHHGLFCVDALQPSVRHTSPQPVLCNHIIALGASHPTTACFVSTHYSPRCVTPHHGLFICVNTLQPSVRHTSPRPVYVNKLQPSVCHTSLPPVLCQHITALCASHLTIACFVSTHHSMFGSRNSPPPVVCQHITACWGLAPRYRRFCVNTSQSIEVSHLASPVLCHNFTARVPSRLRTTCVVTHIAVRALRHTRPSPVLCQHGTAWWGLAPRYLLFCVNT